MLVDTHAHIQADFYKSDATAALKQAHQAGVDRIICVGTDVPSSMQAIEFAEKHTNVWATIGLHPHDAKEGAKSITAIGELAQHKKLVAVGECGLDYYYNHSNKEDQKRALKAQIEIAQKNNLPCIFHVRSAFDDFFEIFDAFHNIRGVVHSFTADSKTMDKVVERGLYLGLNGIMTFTKDAAQLEAARHAPLEYIVLETDSPFLTPTPLRGKINQPANVKIIATFLANLRGESFNAFAKTTTANALKLFNIK